jgi:hypothetical protein
MAVLCAETLLHTENIAETRKTRLEVELGALGEVRGLTVVVQLEEGCTSFYRCLHETWWCNLEEMVFGI